MWQTRSVYPHQAVAKWQAGTALPTIDNLVILAAMLNTKIDDILVIA